MRKNSTNPTIRGGKHTDARPALPQSYVMPGLGNASVTVNTAWYFVDWGKVTRTVKSLQVRIAEAFRKQQHRKVKALQNVLRRCMAAKLLAVRRVTENTGKRTPGVDGELWKTAKDKRLAINGLTGKGYRTKPVRRIYIPKTNGKKRPLGIPTLRDRAMQALHLLCLEPISESNADRNSFGFRPYRACRDAIAQCFNRLSKRNAPEWILEGDIKGCFDNISHTWMLENIPVVSKDTLKKWLKSGFMERDKGLFPTEAGTPQGSIISPTLANMVLDGMENLVRRVAGVQTKSTRTSNPYQIHFVRYADDFIVTSNDRNVLEEHIKPALRQFLAERGLSLSEEKTKITCIHEGFDFLGQNVRKYHNKLLIKPSDKSIDGLLRKVKDIFRRYCTARTIDLIDKLNPILRGWALYHRHIVAKTVFQYIDHKVWRMSWAWAKRRHRHHKPNTWIIRHYYAPGTWVLAAKDDHDIEERLIQLRDIPIRRHEMIRLDANPFDPAQEQYFEKRIYQANMLKHEGRYIHTALLKAQNGKCALCQQPLTELTGINAHHREQKHLGGAYSVQNLVLLHPACHRQVHQLNLDLPSAVPIRKANGRPRSFVGASR